MSFVFTSGNPFTFTWTMLDADGNPVNDATVTATLYSGRSPQVPDTDPGSPVEHFDALDLAFIPDSNGKYAAAVSGAFDPGIGEGFILVVDAVRAMEILGHWEIPALVQGRTN